MLGNYAILYFFWLTLLWKHSYNVNYDVFVFMTLCIWRGRAFTFTALPFGLCIAPAVFQGLINYPLKLYRAQGIHCLGYLDDLPVFAPSKAQ